ncbi:MAG: DUF998 domain-containing protein [Bacteroidetes bacterium]|nr:DUF998 domain-containing protein [Bacteroidota bacterium]
MKTDNRIKILSVASYLGFIFLFLLTTLHLLEPEFDPTWRVISEYELGKFGWLMRLAFFCWGGGFLLLTISLWNTLEGPGGKIGKWWLLIISIALFGAGIFIPQPITDIVRGTTDKLHGLCGAIMIFTLPIASTIIAFNLTKQQANSKHRKLLFWLTVLVWIGIIAFFYSIIFYLEQAKTRAYGPDVLIGLPNRFMVLTYTIWLIGVARILIFKGNDENTSR